tara:strand:+ start:347 stop:1015 length:669 start_codon:yes stop_codon:yes gene_type:complete
MLQQISKKISFYLFLFLILGTLNNKDLTNKEFPKIKKINVEGLKVRNDEFIKKLELLKKKSLFDLNKSNVKELLNSNNLIEEYTIFKKYPSSLEIKILETTLLGLINKNGTNFYIGSNGKLIKANDELINLPFIFGELNIKNFLFIKKIIDHSKLDYKEVQNLFFFPSGRWDIELSSGVLIKLPTTNTKKLLDLSLNLINSNNFNNIKSIDARPLNQVIINE